MEVLQNHRQIIVKKKLTSPKKNLRFLKCIIAHSMSENTSFILVILQIVFEEGAIGDYENLRIEFDRES